MDCRGGRIAEACGGRCNRDLSGVDTKTSGVPFCFRFSFLIAENSMWNGSTMGWWKAKKGAEKSFFLSFSPD